MIKRVLSILLVFITLYFIGVYIHTEVLENKGITVPFSLKKLYQFHAGFSILVCINILLLDSVNKLLEQLGFIYLGTMLIKIVLFSATFYQAIIKGGNLIMAAKLSLLVPTFIFLLTEVFFVVKIMNRKH